MGVKTIAEETRAADTGSAVTLENVKNDPRIDSLLRAADSNLGVLGYTEHGYRHAGLVAHIAYNILNRLDYPQREAELAAIAGYCHDIGNAISRNDHGMGGAALVYPILSDLGMDTQEIAIIISAIGNHEEEVGQAVNPVSAALILADKSDVHRSRVRNNDFATFDIHDRVSYAATHSFLDVDPTNSTITLELTIETEICPVMEYFEIFLTRMMMCRRSAGLLDCDFGLVINEAQLL